MRSTCLAMLLPVLAAMTATAGSPAVAPPKIVILLTIDTLRTDAVSHLGCDLQTTPFLDTLARRGVVFERAYSTSSWTVPAMASMLTSLYPSAHGVVRGDIQTAEAGGKALHEQPMLADSFQTLAELLKAKGYRTIGVVANSHLQAGTGFKQGFDYYYDEARFLHAEQVNRTVRDLMTRSFGADWRKTWKKQPTFLWIHYFDPHHYYTPRLPWIKEYAPDFLTEPESFPARLSAAELNEQYTPEATELRRRVTALYHSEVRYADEYLRIIYEELDPGDDALVIFTSDHGEELGDRTMFGHRYTLFNETGQVPLLLLRPTVLPQGKRLDAVVSLVDLLPTIAEMTGCPIPEGIHGESLQPLLSGKRKVLHDAVFLELHPPYNALRAVVSNRWKLIQPFDLQGPGALFDLEADPGELHDVAGRHRRQQRHLRRRLAAWVKGLPAPPEVQLFSNDDQEEIEQLRALGYVD